MAWPTGALAEIAMVQSYNGSEVLNVFQYDTSGVAGTVSAANIAEAWWNHVKTTWRPMISINFGDYFTTVRIRELNNPVGEFAEWNVPALERVGTRTPPAQPQSMPQFVATGVRLLVGTRATRPGQKRFMGALEQDNDSGLLNSAWTALIVAHMNAIDSIITLGAPAAAAALQPVIVRKDSSGAVTAQQDIIGYLINPAFTSQNTRKIGRGA